MWFICSSAIITCFPVAVHAGKCSWTSLSSSFFYIAWSRQENCISLLLAQLSCMQCDDVVVVWRCVNVWMHFLEKKTTTLFFSEFRTSKTTITEYIPVLFLIMFTYNGPNMPYFQCYMPLLFSSVFSFFMFLFYFHFSQAQITLTHHGAHLLWNSPRMGYIIMWKGHCKKNRSHLKLQ